MRTRSPLACPAGPSSRGGWPGSDTPSRRPMCTTASRLAGCRAGPRRARLSAAVLSLPEPDRAALRQAQGASAQGGRLHFQPRLRRNRRAARELRSQRVRQLIPPCRLRFYLNSIRSSAARSFAWGSFRAVAADVSSYRAEGVTLAHDDELQGHRAPVTLVVGVVREGPGAELEP